MCPFGTNSLEDLHPRLRMAGSPVTDDLLYDESDGSESPAPISLCRTNHHHSKASSNVNETDPEGECCRHCGSRALRVDWGQGDKVCTNCGVVAEEKICDDRPEWREFHDADDLAKGLPASARCGMVSVDESRYLGGLQPTTLSRVPFGGTGTGATVNRVARIRKRLLATNHKLDHMMGIRHARALQDARLSRLIRKRQLEQNPGAVETDQSDIESVVGGTCDIPPELEQILIQEEEDVNRMQAALNADKWSLRRALLLHGSGEELDYENGNNLASEREELSKRLDSKLRKASADLYKAYCILQEASRRLDLPDRVTNEATTMLCRYAARRNGFAVKGVSSRLSSNKDRAVALSEQKQKEAAETLREHNKLKQMGSLAAALLLLTARNLGWARPLLEICGSIHQPSRSVPDTRNTPTGTFIKPKHCSRAMDEIKSAFPDYARSVAATTTGPTTTVSSILPSRVGDATSTSNFVDHSLRKLRLPPVAEAAIRALVWQCRKEQIATGQNSGTKLSTLCASLAYFVCLAGSIMQRLAEQAQRSESNRATHTNSGMTRKNRALLGRKNLNASMGPPPSKKPKTASNSVKKSTEQVPSIFNEIEEEEEVEEPFDVFSHNITSEEVSQKREYEMRRVWDTWSEQTTWFRTLADVEQSSGVSCSVILDHYRSSIYPRRRALLEMLRDAVTDSPQQQQEAKNNTASSVSSSSSLTDTPLAPILLSHVAVAAPLLNKKGKPDS